MNLKNSTLLKRYLILITLLILLSLAKQTFSSEIKSEFKFCLIHYSNPYQTFDVPLLKEDLEISSAHKVMIGNKEIMNKLGKIIVSLKEKGRFIPKPNTNMGYFLKIDLYNKTGDYYTLTATRDKGFELNDFENKIHEGGISKKVYKELVAICESLIDIADVNYQWRLMIE